MPGLQNLEEVCGQAERRLAEGDAVFAADLAIAAKAESSKDAAREVWQYDAVFDFLLRLLATTRGRRHVEQALRVLAAAERSERKRARLLASMLAGSQAPEDLAPAFAGGDSGLAEELRACLVHELVLREVAIDAVPAIHRWAQSPHWRPHPLGGLPLRPAAFEKAPALPTYSARGHVVSVHHELEDGAETSGGASHRPSAVEVTTAAFRSGALAAVRNWSEDSNGRIEARAFDLAGPVAPDALPGLLTRLGLESVEGVGDRSTIRLSHVTADRAWRCLFAAASSGGAYGSGHHGAYGRLHAWRSIAALTGGETETSPARTERRVRAWAWFDFAGATDWFDKIAWDLGLVALAPDARRLTVLAATDTD